MSIRGCGGEAAGWKGKLEIRLGRAAKRGGHQMSQNLLYFGGLVMQMMQGLELT